MAVRLADEVRFLASCTPKSASVASVKLLSVANKLFVSIMACCIALKRASNWASNLVASVDMAADTAAVTAVVMSASA